MEQTGEAVGTKVLDEKIEPRKTNTVNGAPGPTFDQRGLAVARPLAQTKAAGVKQPVTKVAVKAPQRVAEPENLLLFDSAIHGRPVTVAGKRLPIQRRDINVSTPSSYGLRGAFQSIGQFGSPPIHAERCLQTLAAFTSHLIAQLVIARQQSNGIDPFARVGR